ncbi:tetratricopeptide repeat protein 8-like [Planococcus citri]|uniref:tetratricopeptide repeat protein 8-like n=1 Tax=Planococcus citri TaxID=170843 RepID=UPI0031F7AAFC
MNSFYEANLLFRKKQYSKCVDICTNLLMKNSLDQAVWVLKMRALTLQVMVDDIEAEEEGIADMFLDTDTIAVTARPGTSLRTANTSTALGNLSHRPRTVSGRPVSGVVRPGTQAGGGETLQQMLRTPRTAQTARPLTSKSARSLRLGTASMVSQLEGPFIQISRLNLAKYAAQKSVSKPLFEYIYYHENDVRNAMDLAIEATKACEYKDPWWKIQLGKCYFLIGLNRDAEKQFKSALKQQPTIEVYLRLARIYLRLDQPITALDLFVVALKQFPNEVTIMTEMARIFEGLNNIPMSVKSYKEILREDATNMEAVACIGVHHFYTDQPDIGLRFYRRLLQMGLYNAELFNNLGLCCFYAQQYDMVVTCFERALSLAVNDNAADVWYNIGHIAIGVGDLDIAEQCLRLALSIDSTHAASFNNLGVIMFNRGNSQQACSFFDSATSIAPYLFEPHYNRAYVSHEIGDLQTSYILVKKSLKAYPGHVSSEKLLDKLKVYFNYL